MFNFSILQGGAKQNRVVIVALYPIVKESFQLYYDITEILGILIDRFMELEVPDSVKVYDIFCRVSKQFNELESFYEWCKTVGIARSSEYPDVEKITQKKLELMDEFIRDKSALAQSKRFPSVEPPKPETQEDVKEEETDLEDMNSIKALPPPEGFKEEEVKEEPKTEEKQNNTQEEADFLNLGSDNVSTEEHGNQLALALFDGATSVNPSPNPGWEAFNDESADWETALVQTASNLSNQKKNLGGGFDMMLLDGMYQQGLTNAAMCSSGVIPTGSESSVAIGSAGRPAMLALPAPPMSSEGAAGTSNADPFAASLAVAPPPYVQMTELEKKQRLLVEEQMMWQQYARDGMQGQVGLGKLQQNSYNMGGCTRQY